MALCNYIARHEIHLPDAECVSVTAQGTCILPDTAYIAVDVLMYLIYIFLIMSVGAFSSFSLSLSSRSLRQHVDARFVPLRRLRRRQRQTRQRRR